MLLDTNNDCDPLHGRRQTRPLDRDTAPRQTRKKLSWPQPKSGHSLGGAQRQDGLTDLQLQFDSDPDYMNYPLTL
jgi:hypothetical protein